MGSAASRDAKTITLDISSDNERSDVPQAAATTLDISSPTTSGSRCRRQRQRRSQITIRNAIDNKIVQLPYVPGKVIAMVFEYCIKHAAAVSSGEAANEELRSFDEEFIDVDQFMLYDLLVAAYYLQVQGLLDLACQEVCDRLEDKTRVESRKTFRIKDDYFVPAPLVEDDDEEQWFFV
ncbi:unnamed protein product [Urochloa humidicola]